jgi:hypothetical protein
MMKGDLVVIAADGGTEQAIRGILERPAALGIRRLEGVEFPKLKELDAGTYARGHELASLYSDSHSHALVVFDLAWEGCPTDMPHGLESIVEGLLEPVWETRGRCVVIRPELEAWVWSDSPHVAKCLGWDGLPELRTWLENKGLWNSADPKPADPKRAYIAAIEAKRFPKSNSNFRCLASRVSFSRCQDPAFLRLRQILLEWFPPLPQASPP